jgi:hypothetical protein
MMGNSTRSARSLAALVFVAAFLAEGLNACAGAHNASSAPQSAVASSAWTLEPVSTVPASGQSPATADGFDYTATAITISEQGFSIEQGPPATGSKGPLRAFVVICTGSADGHCGTVDFFYVNRLIGYLPARQLGTSTILPYNARIVSEAGRHVTIDLDISRPTDALCCATGGTISVNYYWTGHGVLPSGPQAAKAPTVVPPTNLRHSPVRGG